MKTHGELRWHSSTAEVDLYFGDGDGHAVWAVNAAPYVAIKVKRLFPRVSTTARGWLTILDTPEVARDLEWLLGRYPMEMSTEVSARLASRAEEHRATERFVHEILTGAAPALEFEMTLARKARDYQTVAADLALTTGRLLLTDELGLGKTMTALLLLRGRDALPALVVCPTHLPAQWADELAKTLPFLRPHVVRKGSVYDPKDHRSMRGHDPDVLIMGYSKLRGWGQHLAGKVRTVIFDEAQELRVSGSQKWVAAKHVADQATYRMGLTATPVYNYGGEIHTIFEILAPGVLGSREEFVREWGGGSYHASFSDHVSVKDPAGLGEYLRSEGLMLRRTRKQVGRELPEVIRVPHSIDSDEDVVDTLVEEAIDLAELIVTRASRRQELWRASGEFDWRIRRATGLAKAPYVAEFVKMLLENDEQVVLFGWHRDVYDIWKSKLAEFDPVFYTGSESPTQKQASRDAFIGGRSRVLIMSLRAGSGLDGLQEVAHVAVFGELDWSPGMHDQCIGRLHRDGQGEPVVAYFLVSDHGSDPPMAEVLNVKRQQSEPLQNPEAQLFQPVEDHQDRIRKLAEAVIAKRQRRRT